MNSIGETARERRAVRFSKGIRILSKAAAAGLILFVTAPKPAEAIVGKAEEYDPFEQEALEEFQRSLTLEDRGRDKVQESLEALEKKQKEIKTAAKGKRKDSMEKEIESLKQQILKIPKRDRLLFEINGQHIYESNVERRTPHYEKGDSIFDLRPTAIVDLSGKKTDLRLELAGGKQWNIKFPVKDFWEGSERIRYRRRYFKKVHQAINSKIARHSSKTVEVNQTRVRWDSDQVHTVNLALSKKFSINNDTSLLHRQFTHENFDQDSNWQFTDAPSLFFHLTPKSRISTGYSFGASRIRSKAGDANAHEVHLGYFGAVTRKSSVSFDAAFSHQTPRSRETSRTNTYKTGVGYIWQMTPKSQMVVQLIRSLQDSTSETVSSTASTNSAPQAEKTDTHFINESLSISLNSRLTKKFTTIFTVNGAHFKSKVQKGGDKSSESQQWSLPITLTLIYYLRQWMTLTADYTFSYRRGDAKADEYRDHILKSSLRMIF